MINVTKTYLPPIEKYIDQVNRAFKNGWLTNRGELVNELESNLTKYFGLEKSKILCLNNGTTPLQIALKLLGNGGDVITTPFSYVATTSSILWENCNPIFVDIHPEYLTIDESKIEEAITEKTTCILATHVFGNPCNVDDIELIANRFNLKVIYDAAHCFGVKYKGKSIFEYGDLSTCSFHATKVFHTAEGGGIFCKNQELYDKVYYSHNFGHNGQLDFFGLGINGKMSELHAAIGLSILPYIDDILIERQKLVYLYFNNLIQSRLKFIKFRDNLDWNYSYFPVIFDDEKLLLEVQFLLNNHDIFPRRYFYPSLNKLTFISNQISLPISESISSRILCLPLFNGLRESDINNICKIINNALNVKK